MIKERAWSVRLMYILIAAALAMGLFITAAPAHKVSANSNDVTSEWDKVSTPSEQDWVLAPGSTIYDYALASAGATAYAVVYGYSEAENSTGYWLLKSTDSGATWTDLNTALNKTDTTVTVGGKDYPIYRVATDGTDPDFVAVALSTNGTPSDTVSVYFSTDGGTTFNSAGEVEANGGYLYGDYYLANLAVSPDVSGKRDIFIGGENDNDYAGLFRCTVTGTSASAWKDATTYTGWDNTNDGIATNDLYSYFVSDIVFSPSYATDKTVLVTTVSEDPNDASDYNIYLQSGSMLTTPGWNLKSSLAIAAVLIMADKGSGNTPDVANAWDVLVDNSDTYYDGRAIAGMTLPSDYNSKSTDTRALWVWVNYLDDTGVSASQIVCVTNTVADPTVVKQISGGHVWLTNVSYYGTTAEGEAIAGLIGTGTYTTSDDDLYDIATTGCAGVQVYVNTGIHNMEICCQPWEPACKPPTGTTFMSVSFVSQDEAYAVALESLIPETEDYTESAFSVTFDGGNTWNQLSLIDTYISYLSDVAVSPDCNKMFLVSVNTAGCDSVWVKAGTLPEAEEYSGDWLRTWSGELTGNNVNDFPYVGKRGQLVLPAGETTGDTVFLVDRMSGSVYENDLETLACWTSISSTTQTEIVDMVATGFGSPSAGNSTLYALDVGGDVSLYDSQGWHDVVASKVTNGWSIAVHGSDILVGGRDGDVGYSSDGGDTFALLEETPTIYGLVSVAFDSYYDQNNIVYAATAFGTSTGIYRWVIGTSTEWKDMGAEDYDYTGIVLGFNPGNPMTSADTGGVLYASYVDGERSLGDVSCWSGTKYWDTGVARSLNPAKTIECATCVEWDYLTVGLTLAENFAMAPQALKLCGCMDPTTNGKLFAIGAVTVSSDPPTSYTYDMVKGEFGTVWTFEDCYAKKAPDITSPTGNTTIPCAECGCGNAPFTITWDGLCDACKYEVQFAVDQNFNSVFDTEWVPLEGSTSVTSLVVPGGEGESLLACGSTYYFRVRAYEAGTCQPILSWWSDPMQVTVANTAASAAINLVSPVPGATGVGTMNVGFSWNMLAPANTFSWVLSTHADLSSPVDSKTGLTGTAYTTTATLVHGTTYYWQVTAYQGSTLIGTSAIGTFVTGAQGQFCDPTDGQCFDSLAALQAHEAQHPAPGTPMWVWVVIAIGAVLVIVVIVLIFRTRRV